MVFGHEMVRDHWIVVDMQQTLKSGVSVGFCYTTAFLFLFRRIKSMATIKIIEIASPTKACLLQAGGIRNYKAQLRRVSHRKMECDL
jgi:hypothetical protein